MNRCAISLLMLVLGFCETVAFGEWTDRTAGLPPVETISAKTMGVDGNCMAVTQDKLGRLFIGSNRLLVFDGQAWQSFEKPNSYPITSLAIGDDGKLWAGTTNDLGYFEEESLGEFKYHSLLPFLPKEARDIGIVWGCAPVGQTTYFICGEKLLRWDGKTFQITPFDTAKRLCPMKVDNEWWFYHYETGLYRLNERSPTMEIPPTELENILIMALFRDETGLVTVSNAGFIRPGKPFSLLSEQILNHYLSEHLVSSFAALPDGNLAIGTVSGGLVLASRTGHLIRIWDSKDGLPGRNILSLAIDASPEILGITYTDFFHFPADGKSTFFSAKNGLKGQTVNSLRHWKSTLYALTEDGTFRLETPVNGYACFKIVPELTEVYTNVLPSQNGLLLSRFGGIDTFDGTTIRTVYNISVGNVFTVLATQANPKQFYAPEMHSLASVTEQPDGSFVRKKLLKLTDSCNSLHEDRSGRLLIGTFTKGAFNYDPSANVLSPINDPASGEMLPGSVLILGNDRRIHIFFGGGILEAARGQGLHRLKDMPAFAPLEVGYAPNGQDILVAYQRPHGANDLSHGVGVLSFESNGAANWRELDITSLRTIGPVRSLTFSEENKRPILWLGGTEGILRVDYDKVATLQPPPAPIIRLDRTSGTGVIDDTTASFSFNDHRIKTMVFTGDYVRGKDWLIQTRVGTGNSDWSVPAERRSFEFTNLSEGNYRFEARAVNTAGMVSAPASLTFTILPPWYRTKPAYAGYAAGLALVTFGFIRVRERRVRRYNRELERLVEVRTGELLKANAAKDEFLASVSHEIRNPMNGVLGIAESLKTDALDPESRHKFGLLRQCASHLSSLLEDILDFSRVQAGVELESKPFNVAELMDSIMALTAAESEKSGIRVETAISPAVPQQLTGDPRRIRQILLNYVGNALKFAGRGQVKVTAWCGKISPGSAEVFFAVSDDGPGMPPEEQKKLFTRFERGATAQSGRVPGTGLGLALCRTLAEKMGGRVWMESEAGAGSCFYFSASFATVAGQSQPASDLQAPAGGYFKTALVVDDEEYNRIALTGLLETLGILVQAAADGPEALALASRHDFEVIFLDYALPGQSGPDISREIRQLSKRSAQAVIFAVTAFNTPDKRAQCLAAGMNAFLGKPVTMERLRQALSAVNPSAPPGPEPPSFISDPPDSLGSLRLLASKKGLSFADELALYFSELEIELEQLTTALLQEESDSTSHYAHLLCGRCVFINERELEHALRKVTAAAATGHWSEARSLGHEVQHRLAELRVRLVSDAPVAPLASVR